MSSSLDPGQPPEDRRDAGSGSPKQRPSCPNRSKRDDDIHDSCHSRSGGRSGGVMTCCASHFDRPGAGRALQWCSGCPAKASATVADAQPSTLGRRRLRPARVTRVMATAGTGTHTPLQLEPIASWEVSGGTVASRAGVVHRPGRDDLDLVPSGNSVGSRPGRERDRDARPPPNSGVLALPRSIGPFSRTRCRFGRCVDDAGTVVDGHHGP